ncbi:heat shock protein 70 family [Dimargaris cristalligena]|uniref:Heat shock protein 70 family n=1 Tax=Dimargaris cristalligena TaxID=215637 RepID=A0A4P9ZMC4_9FUNG|nr:heat shock protein 70 family [Dimargaris cristalligena]|eukprot:RKP34265.1 heat shock protein 70 family [Dimargaris cristalligena]
MGIDYGTDFFKVALVAAGKPLDIVLNRDYKRKTQSVVVVKGDERFFGVEAVNKQVRLAEYSYPSVKAVLGRLYSDPDTQDYIKRYNPTMVEDPERKTPLFQQDHSTFYSPEELLAMQIQYARETASAEAGRPITSAVIAVPPFFDQFERQAILDAASLVGVRVLSVINDGASVALNYAMDKSFTEPQSILFYDVGAGSTTATLVRFTSDAMAKSTQVGVQSYGFDRTLGGSELDHRIAALLSEEFMRQFKDQVSQHVDDSPRAKTKLLKEANRVKHILSTNVEARSSIESLLDGHDFRTTVTREQLESLTEDLVPRFIQPIDDALARANMTLAEIQSVVFVGGGLRVPFIDRVLREYVGDDKVARNINGDEAAVKGAALHAASMSMQLKAKGISLKDIVPYPVEVVYGETGSDIVSPPLPPTLIFPADADLDSRRAISFRHASDFAVRLRYPADPTLPHTELSQMSITGLTDAAEGYKPEDLGQPLPKVRLSVLVNENGVAQLLKAEAAFNVTNPVPESSSEASNSESSAAEADSSASSESSSSTTSTALVKVPLKITSQALGVPALSADSKSAARKRFAAMDKSDRRRLEHAEAVNNLESYIYFIRDFVEDEVFHPFASPADRDTLASDANAFSEWLEDTGINEETPIYVEKYDQLKKGVDAIKLRHSEHQDRPKVVTQLQKATSEGLSLLERLAKEYTDLELKNARKDMNSLQQAVDKATTWLTDATDQQAKLALTENPVLLTSEMRAHMDTVDKAHKKLAGRKIRKRPSATASETETDATPKDESDDSSSRPVHDEL